MSNCDSRKVVNFQVQSISGLIKQLFIPNFSVAQLTENKTEDLRRTCWCGLKFKGFVKINRCSVPPGGRCCNTAVPYVKLQGFQPWKY